MQLNILIKIYIYRISYPRNTGTEVEVESKIKLPERRPGISVRTIYIIPLYYVYFKANLNIVKVIKVLYH